jgi:hypothetical protein
LQQLPYYNAANLSNRVDKEELNMAELKPKATDASVDKFLQEIADEKREKTVIKFWRS